MVWLYADGSDGGAVDDVRKLHVTHVSFHVQPGRHYRKFIGVQEIFPWQNCTTTCARESHIFYFVLVCY